MDGTFLRTERDGELAIWWLDQRDSPHNLLSSSALQEIERAIDEAADDGGVHAVVVVSAKPDSFVVGADVRELQSFTSRDEAEALSRRGHALIRKVSSLGKPVVAAIHGPAVGGGLELALACTMRIASDHPATRFALPEVNPGLLPGGGGTQLLPRRIGIQQSLPLLLTGKSLYARPARRRGLVDALIHRAGLLTAAKAAARELVEGRRETDRSGPAPLHERLLESNPLTRRLIYSRAAEETQKKTRGNYPAPPRIIDCVRAGIEEGFEKGLEAEAAAFGDLSVTPESKGLVRLFFAKREAEKNPFAGSARPVDRIGVLGAGLMGSGIAEVSAENGLDVVVKDQTLELAAQARKHVYRSASRQLKKGAMSRFERDLVVERVTPAADYEAFAAVDLVIEAAPEQVDLKQQLIRDVETAVREDCIFASNTSSIPISTLAEASVRPELLVGMHYFSPVPKVPLLEVIRTDRTPEWVLATACEVGLRQGKTVVVVNDGPGFYTTRILALYMNEALNLLDDGADVEAVDRSMRDFGFPMGPYELFDLIGVDVASKITQVLGDFMQERGIHANHKADAIVAAGYKGQKTGRGFYAHDGRKRGDVNEKIYGFFTGERTTRPADEIQERLALTLVNEAANCLEDGILNSAVDGDVAAVFGLGFPPFRGGPFRYADRLGPKQVVERLDVLRSRHGEQFRPAEPLQRLAREARTFY
jgi:3-hydroxyacyl-CoA dehydrogenase / enoyl-CoA hydratase / 3-hydroxybutyryl-CoA epimerase